VDPLTFTAGFVLVTLLGVGMGLVTGLSPGLHVNNVAALVLATRPAWIAGLAALLPSIQGDPIADVLLACFLLATAASHAVFDFVPSVFFGAPSEDTALATLPGHRLLLEGHGARAVSLAARGALLGVAFASALVLPLRWLLADPVGLADAFRPWTGPFLGVLLLALLASDVRSPRRIRRVALGAWTQLLSGLLGLAVLRGPGPLTSDVVLFPLFSGLFGIPSLVVGIRAEPGAIPEQRVSALPALSRADLRCAIRGTLAGASVSWLPGLSGGSAATLASIGRRSTTPAAFLVVLGAVSSSTTLLSVAVLFIIHRARSGAAAAVRDLVGEPDAWSDVLAIPDVLLALVMSAVLASAVAAPLASAIGRAFAVRWAGGNPRRLSLLCLFVLVGLIGLATGPAGVGIALVASVVGYVPVALGVRRVHLMASLLVPVLATHLGWPAS